MKKIINNLVVTMILSLILASCGGGSGDGGSSTSGTTPPPPLHTPKTSSVTDLKVENPLGIASFFQAAPNTNTTEQIIITNPTNYPVTGIIYQINNLVDNGGAVIFNSNSTSSCQQINANSNCILSVSVSNGLSTGGVFNLSILGTEDATANQTKITKNTISSVTVPMSVEIINNNHQSDISGISFTYPSTINADSSGTSNAIINVNIGANVSGFNNPRLVSSDSSHVSLNAQLLNPISGTIPTNHVLEFRLPIQGSNATQNFMFAMDDASGNTTYSQLQVIQVTSNAAIINILPQTVINPSGTTSS